MRVVVTSQQHIVVIKRATTSTHQRRQSCNASQFVRPAYFRLSRQQFVSVAVSYVNATTAKCVLCRSNHTDYQLICEKERKEVQQTKKLPFQRIAEIAKLAGKATTSASMRLQNFLQHTIQLTAGVFMQLWFVLRV